VAAGDRAADERYLLDTATFQVIFFDGPQAEALLRKIDAVGGENCFISHLVTADFVLNYLLSLTAELEDDYEAVLRLIAALDRVQILELEPDALQDVSVAFARAAALLAMQSRTIYEETSDNDIWLVALAHVTKHVLVSSDPNLRLLDEMVTIEDWLVQADS
jgi:predicted nucleic acid-binding protein